MSILIQKLLKKCKQLLNILKISISIFLCPCFRLNFCNLNTLFLIERSKSCQMKNNIFKRINEQIVRGQALVYFLLPFKQRAYIVCSRSSSLSARNFFSKGKNWKYAKILQKIKIILLSTKCRLNLRSVKISYFLKCHWCWFTMSAKHYKNFSAPKQEQTEYIF